MKENTTIRIYPSIIMGMIFMLTFSCKEDDNNNNITAPVLTTSAISDITQTTATCGGNITNNGGSTVTVRGVCWSIGQTPTISDSITIDGTGSGSYTSTLTGLSPATPYYVRAYATNDIGTAYGNQVSFTTSGGGSVPTITTDTITNIIETSATGGGNVTSEGSSPVTARGVCWSTLQNPTNSDAFTTDGSGTGSFTSNITGLSENTPYYVRAYATNSEGTSYGDQVSFTTTGSSGGEPCPGIPTLLYEGKTYNTVQIGAQCWLKENLNVGVRINGAENQNSSNGTIEKYCYEDLESNCDIFGGLYQWDEMMIGSTTPGVQGICPVGWYIPTDADWTILTTFLGGDSMAGGKLKETGIAHWSPPNTGATNSSGFSGLPGGNRGSIALWYNWSVQGIFHSSNDGAYPGGNIYGRSLDYNNESVEIPSLDKHGGFSVRCIQQTDFSATITGTAAFASGTSGDLSNSRVSIYTSWDNWNYNQPYKSTNTIGTGDSVTYMMPDVLPGSYFLDVWKDIDNNGNWTVGDFVGWYGTGDLGSLALIEFQISQGQTLNLNVQMYIIAKGNKLPK